MALGKPVICCIKDEYKHYLPDLPIVHATPSTITDVLRQVIQDKSLRLKAGKDGAVFVASHHDVDRELAKLIVRFGLN